MKIDHICLAVRSLDKAGPRLTKTLGYQPRTAPVSNSAEQVDVQFFRKEGSVDMKLIAPTDRQSPLIDFLKKHGEGLHHLAFMTDDVTKAVQTLEARGAHTTAQPAPGEAFDDELIAFSYVGFGLNVELIDTDKRRSPLDAG